MRLPLRRQFRVSAAKICPPCAMHCCYGTEPYGALSLIHKSRAPFLLRISVAVQLHTHSNSTPHPWQIIFHRRRAACNTLIWLANYSALLNNGTCRAEKPPRTSLSSSLRRQLLNHSAVQSGRTNRTLCPCICISSTRRVLLGCLLCTLQHQSCIQIFAVCSWKAGRV